MFQIRIRVDWVFLVIFGQHVLQYVSMFFGFAILEMCFYTCGGHAYVVCLHEVRKWS